MKRTTEITLEIEEKIVLRQGEIFIAAFCKECQSPVNMASPQIAAILHGSSEREIFRLVEAGCIHFIELNRILICLDSLLIPKK